MLERIEGTVTSVDETGFCLAAGPFTLRLLGSRELLSGMVPGRTVSLQVHLQLQLEGNRIVPVAVAFCSGIEKELFDDFMTVSGVGARAAIRALSRPATDIARAISTGDERFLTTLPGIGKAKARQIVASLQEKVASRWPSIPASVQGGAPELARAVLIQLGLGGAEADSLLEKALSGLGTGCSEGDLVREAMRLRSAR
jgi:Holliday junction DNA helicase RuvA